jgi:4-carboxymuconolactone decarboxylase
MALPVWSRLRELIILRSAYLLDCPYEWQANIVMAKNTGCTPEQIDAMTSQGPITLRLARCAGRR